MKIRDLGGLILQTQLNNCEFYETGKDFLWGGFSSCLMSQLHMLRIPGSIPATHPRVGTGGTVL